MIEDIIEVLELLIKKNGSMPLTTQHLLNILRLLKKRAIERDVREWQVLDDLLAGHGRVNNE